MVAGRQRQFDEREALDRAMSVFWSNGYKGTSLSDLTEAMGINKPSLYAAFGNKEALFVSALNRYVAKHGSPHTAALSEPNRSVRYRVREYLKSIAHMVSDPTLPGGCFVAATTSEAGGECFPEGASSAIVTINRRTRRAFVDFFRREIAAGNIDGAEAPESLADYLLTLQYGLAVMARNGTEADNLEKVIDHAVASF